MNSTPAPAPAPRLDSALRDPVIYQFWHPIAPRFGDLDALGHVSHVNVVRWLEEARVVLEWPIQPLDQLRTGPVMVLADLRVEFLEEAHLGQDVRVGVTVQRLGKSSVTIGQGIFAAPNQQCIAIAELVEVLIDQATRKSVPFPAEFRNHFGQYVR